MKTYLIGDGQVDEIIQAESMEQAKSLAADWIREGSWDQKCEIDVRVVEIDPSQDDGRDRRGAEIDDPEWITVEVGEDPQEPDCVDGETHDWRGVGGCSQNPGVFSLGGTKLVFYRRCEKCGWDKRTVSVGSQRNPGEVDTVEYHGFDEYGFPIE